jgi:hypothetical protein
MAAVIDRDKNYLVFAGWLNASPARRIPVFLIYNNMLLKIKLTV